MKSSSKDHGDEEERVKVEVKIYMDERLRDVAAEYCERKNVHFSDVAAELLADFFGRKDLGIVPRKRVGRKLGTKMKKGKK